MNKTLNINLGGLIFHIDEDAYHKLERYLGTLKRQFAGKEGGSEIIKDIELRIAELFKERTSGSKEVISQSDVEEVIAIMGKPEDYLDGDEQGNDHYEYAPPRSSRRIFRDPDDRILGGVAAGLAAYFNIDPLWMRLLFVVLVLSGFGILFYLILWLVMPKATTTVEKLQMRGESVNISNIERSIKEELREVEKNVKNFSKRASQYDYGNAGNQVGGFLRELGSFLLQAIKIIFKFVFILIGFAFLALGFIFLFGVVFTIFTGGVYSAGSASYNLNDALVFLQLLTVNSTHFMFLMAGVALLLLAPLAMIIYLGIRIIFRLDRMNKSARSGLIAAAVIGFFLILFSSVRIFVELDERSYYTYYQNIPSSKDLYLRVNEDNIYGEFQAEGFAPEWLPINGKNAFTQVYLDIKRSEGEEARLKIEVRSQGDSRRTARENARKTDYTVVATDSIIDFNAYYILGKDEKYRGQEVKITLFLPEGRSVFLDENMVDIIYAISNVDNYWDFDMVNHRWLMTRQGLKCTDCPEVMEDTDQREDGSEKETLEMKINEKGVRLKISQYERPLKRESLLLISSGSSFI